MNTLLAAAIGIFWGWLIRDTWEIYRRQKAMDRMAAEWEDRALRREADIGCVLLLDDAIHHDKHHPLPKERR